VLLTATGLLFGLPELVIVAGAVAAATVAAFVIVAVSPLHLEVGREPRPRRVTVGDHCNVHLRIRNAGLKSSPIVRLIDQVSHHGRVVLSVAPLDANSERDTAYRLPTTRRGEELIGPISIEREDPFGLFRRTLHLAGVTSVVVRPEVVTLSPLPAGTAAEPDGNQRLRVPVASLDEDIAGLRPYQPGDDVRRVHWRTTARIGYPVVRQHDAPTQQRTTVLIDVRRTAHDSASFERAMSAAASIIMTLSELDDLRLLTTGGVDIGPVPAVAEMESILDLLALAQPSPDGSLPGTLANFTPSGRLVLVVGTLERIELAGLLQATAGASWRTLVTCAPLPADADPGAVPVIRWDGTSDPVSEWFRLSTLVFGGPGVSGPGSSGPGGFKVHR